MKKSLLTSFLLFGIFTGNAQILDRIKNAAKNAAERKAESKSGDAVDKGLEKVEEGIGNIFKKKDEPGNNNSQSGNTTNSGANQNTTQNGNTDYSQYKGSTFIPGKNVLFFEDFATARLGTGNANWHLYEYDPSADFERPNVRIISVSDGNWLKMPRKGFVFPNSFKNLPEQFTIEFDMYADPAKMSEMESGFKTNFVAKDDREEYSIHWSTEPAISLDVHPHGSTQMVNIMAKSEYNSNLDAQQMTLFDKTYKTGWLTGKVNRISIYRNAKQVVLYLNGKEMLNLPNALPKKAQYNLILSTNLWGDGIFVTNFRVEGNVPNATQEIKTAGKFVTNTIYFDVNSSRIKPESWATLNNTAQAIKSTAGNYLIVGHTDSDGADDANLKLSQSRAASVKNALVKEFGIDASRLVTDGKGESQPVTSNNTASGKAQNRRVEFIKQ